MEEGLKCEYTARAFGFNVFIIGLVVGTHPGWRFLERQRMG